MNAGPPISLNPRLRQHSDYNKLRVNPNYFWDRMLASVSRPSTVAGECAMLREAAEQTDKELHGFRDEISELRRTLAECQAQRDDGAPSPQDSRGNNSIPRIRGRVIA